MASVTTYLNFPNYTEKAFEFYRSVFGGEFIMPIARFKDIPAAPGAPPMSEDDQNLVMYVALPITGGHILKGTDAPQSMGFQVNFGNNMHINLELDTREETMRLFNALSAGGVVEMEPQEMFWGAFFGSCKDQFGVQWMFSCDRKD